MLLASVYRRTVIVGQVTHYAPKNYLYCSKAVSFVPAQISGLHLSNYYPQLILL